MICILQRVSQAQVDVADQTIGKINHGMMVLCGFQPEDNQQCLKKMAHKLAHYRIFSDENDKMNLNIQQVSGEFLLVPQFTLAADTSKGLRPSFHTSASPAMAASLFEDFIQIVTDIYQTPQTGQFGSDMQVSLINNGPVTFRLET